MKITNNHKGELGLPDGQILPAGEATDVPGWDKIKNNAVVQGWIAARILSVEKTAAGAKGQPASLRGSDLLPAQIELVEGVTVQLGDVVRAVHEASGLSIEDWNSLDDTVGEAKLADAVERLRSEAIAEAEAKKTAASTADSGAGSVDAGAGGSANDDGPDDKGVLVAKAKALSIPGVGGHWGIDKLKQAIAEAEAKKIEG